MSDQIPSSEFSTAVPSVPMTAAPAPVSILRTWINAITRPQVATYAAIAASPNATPWSAFFWIWIASTVVLLVMRGNEAGILQALARGQNVVSIDIESSLTAICAVPLLAVVSVPAFAILVWLTNVIARALGGQGAYNAMVYTWAAITVPVNFLSVILSLLAAIPYVGFCFVLLSIPLALYGWALQVIAVKALHNISWSRAIVAAVGVPVVLTLGIACLTIAFLMVLGPVIGNTFSTINSSLP